MQSQIDSLQSQMDTILGLTKFLNGHPIMALRDPSDIAQFDTTTGIGSGDWIGWGICNGNTYTGPDDPIISPDLRDRFIVGSQGSYSIGNVGGLDTVTLSILEMPTHSHGLTDPGHSHGLTDPGHNHNVVDPGHTHAASSVPHQHTFTTDAAGDHAHTYEKIDVAGSDYYIPELIATHQIDFSFANDDTTINGNHTHTGITDMAAPGINVVTAFTGVNILNAFTGMTVNISTTGITMATEGGSQPHENRPPYYALLLVQKIF